MGQLKAHLHYGGSISSKSHKLGMRPQQGRTFRSQKRFETIIRLENAAFPDTAIAAMLCISVPRLQMIKRSPEYLAARVQLTHGIILDNDSKVSQIKSQRREILTAMLPPALQIIADELQRPAHTFAERKHKTALAQDLLDREGLFAKISKTEIKPVDGFDFEKADAESAAIIHALTSAAAPPSKSLAHSLKPSASILGHHTAEAVAANEEFSNSHTLSAVDQQAALDSLEAEAATLDSILLDLPVEGKPN